MKGRAGTAVLGLLGLLAAGCAQKQPDPVHVQGSIVYNGKPAGGVLVTFWPEDSRRRSASALCDSAGKFTLECVYGPYKVTVSPNLQDAGAPGLEGGAARAPRSLAQPSLAIPQRFQSTSMTPLRVEVPEGGSDNLVVTLR
jgi:hypothetical protein